MLQGYGVNLRNYKFPSGYTVNDIRKTLLNGDHVLAKVTSKNYPDWTRIIGIRRTRYGATLGRPFCSNDWYVISDCQPWSAGM